MLTGFAGYSGNRGVGGRGLWAGTGKERRRRDTEGLRVMGNRGRRFKGARRGGVRKVCVRWRKRGWLGLSAPRRQPLNPCRPEWWCLS